MSDDGRPKLSPAEAKMLGESRESWCAVEMKKEQSWCRKERRHNKDQFSSTVFQQGKTEYEKRCAFQMEQPKIKERRHFHKQYQSELKI
ncbi:hypothetical protein ScPMuIL_014618 [Solemya velum]